MLEDSSAQRGLTPLLGVALASCLACGHRQIAGSRHCPICLGDDFEIDTAVRSGTLYSFTIIRQGTPDGNPLALGYVDTLEGVRLLARLRPPVAGYECDAAVEVFTEQSQILARPVGTGHA